MDINNTEKTISEEKKEWMYDAFISYRHIEPDAFVAGAIHKLLEAYNPPKSIFKGKNPEDIKRTKIKKVFRDQEELPLTSNLSDTIGLALENSEYLIVICSPRFGESLWCKKEVETFIKLHGKEKVLTVLVDGEPSESFPEELLYREIEVTKEDGTVEIIKEPIEPLAANARGNSNKERFKLLKTETLRLMAPMFGVSFDDLKQRHKEQKLRRTIQAVAAAAGICFLFGIVSTTMALKINRQNTQITEQNAQITEQNEQISKQAEQIQKQYEEALVSNGEATTQLAVSLYEDGNRVEAVKAAYSVFPSGDNKVPYLQTTQKILTDALALYDFGDAFLPDRIVKAGSVIKECQVSPSGKVVAVSDEAFGIYVWDASNGKLISQKNAGDVMYADSFNITFKDDSRIFTTIDGVFVLYDIETDEVIFELDEPGVFKSFYNEMLDRVLIYNYDKVILADGSTGEIIYKDIKSEDDDSLSRSIDDVTDIKYANQKYYAYVIKYKDVEESTVEIRDLEDGNLVKQYNVKLDSISKLRLYEESLFISENIIPERYYEIIDSPYENHIYRYDFLESSDGPVWIHSSQGSLGSDFGISGTGNYATVGYYASFEILDMETGEVKKQHTTDDQIQALFSYADSDSFSIVTRKGIFYTVTLDYPDLIESSFFQANVENLKYINVKGGIIGTVPYNSTELTIYRIFEHPDRQDIYGLDNYVDEIGLSEDSSKLYAFTYNDEALLIDRISGEVTKTERIEEDSEDEIVRELKEKYIADLGIPTRAVANSAIGADGRLFLVVYKDKSFDIYRINGSGVIADSKEHFSAFGLFNVTRIETNPEGTLIWIDGETAISIIDMNGESIENVTPSEKMIVATINSGRFVDLDNGYVYCSKSDELIRYPLYSRDAIADIAAKEIANEE